MLQPNCEIQIKDSATAKGGWVIGAYCNIDNDGSVDNLTETCTVTFPKKIKWKDQLIATGDNPILKRGMYVKIKMGYKSTLKTRFIGYIRDINNDTPVKITCDDSMYLLKNGRVNASYGSITRGKRNKKIKTGGVTLRNLLEDIIPDDIEFVVPEGEKEINLGVFRASNASVTQILDELKKTYGLRSYFRLIPSGDDYKPVIYVGLTYWTDNQVTGVFKEGHNIISLDKLTFRRKADIKLKVHAISILPNNTKIEVEVGDTDGELRTVYRYNATKAELTQFANAELDRLKYDGFTGSFDTFGEPSLVKGDIAHIKANEGTGKYLVKKVVRKHGTEGYKQTIELGAMLWS